MHHLTPSYLVRCAALAGPFVLFAHALGLPLASTASRTAGFARTPDVRSVDDDGHALTEAEFDDLVLRTRSGNKWTRKRALEHLAESGDARGWELIVAALADRKGEVADTAQLVLAGIRSSAALERLGSKDALRARDEWVRRRAAEALGRLADDVDPESVARMLVGALGDKDPEVRRMALWSVERRARRGLCALNPTGDETPLHAAVRTRLAREREHGVRARALAAYAALDPTAARDIVRRELDARHAAARCMATALVPELFAADDAIDWVRPRALDAERAVRVQAIDALARLGTRAALAAMIERLADDMDDADALDERGARRIVEHLRRVSGRKHRRDPRPWRDWVAGLPDNWRAPSDGGSALDPDDDVERSVSEVSFGGLPILSTRLTFLIDLSGSMWTVRPDGLTRKQVVEEMLREALERLPESTRFNVIPFTERPRPFKDELVRASRKNVRAAIEFFEDCNERGTGNFWDAAMLACADPDVDTLLVLTDGAPTGGRRHRLELMVPLFAEFDATRKIAVDSLLIDAKTRELDAWDQLARLTGGHSMPIDL